MKRENKKIHDDFPALTNTNFRKEICQEENGDSNEFLILGISPFEPVTSRSHGLSRTGKARNQPPLF